MTHPLSIADLPVGLTEPRIGRIRT